MTISQTILAGVPEADRHLVARQANRAVNMAGWRYSDALRAELETYERIGADAYRALDDESTRIVRGLGY